MHEQQNSLLHDAVVHSTQRASCMKTLTRDNTNLIASEQLFCLLVPARQAGLYKWMLSRSCAVKSPQESKRASEDDLNLAGHERCRPRLVGDQLLTTRTGDEDRTPDA